MLNLCRTLRLKLALHHGTRSFSRSSARQARYVRFSEPNGGPTGSGFQRGPGGSKRGFFNDRNWPIKVGAGITGLGVLYYVACLEQVPETGRWRFMAVGPEAEAQVGELTRQQTLQQFGEKVVPSDHPLSRHVQRIVQRILEASNLGVVKGQTLIQQHPSDDLWSPHENFSSSDTRAIASPNREWNVLVVDDRRIVNAAATPGTVIVFTGILPICKDEQGLSAVLSHEIGHVVARHTAEQLSSQSVALALMLFLSVLGLDMGLSSVLHTMLLELPNSRQQEREADIIGMRLMSKACYDPKAAPEMFARLGQLEAKAGMRAPQILNTHPSSESRVQNLEDRLSEAYAILAANPECAQLQDQIQSFRDSARMRNIFAPGTLPDHEETWT